MRTTKELKEAFSAVSLPEGDWIERLDALEAAGIVSGIASAPKSRWRGLIMTLGQLLGFDDDGDEIKSLREAVTEAASASNSESEEGDEDSKKDPDGDTIAQLLVALGRQDELFHDDAGGAFAAIDHGENGRETVVIGSERHEEILSLRLWQEHALPPSSSSLHDAMRTLRAMAKADGKQRSVHLRHHWDGTRLWYDLADERRRAVEITTSGWRIVNKPEVYFLRHKNTRAQVEPVMDGSIELLRQLVNVDQAHWPLFVGWLVQALMPGSSRMGMMLGGAQDSAKSTNAKLARAVVDPARAPTTALPRNEDDFAVVASTNAILAADNVSSITREMSDMVCACITGDGYARRTKYRDTDETIWQFQRPVLLNGIGNVIHFPDLLDRVLLVRCPAIRPEKRRRERELWGQYRKDAPAILGALFTAAAGMLRELDRVQVPGDIRMSDAAQVMLAAARGLGLDEGEMLVALRANAAEQVREAIEESVIAQPLLDYLSRNQGYEGTMGTLLERISMQVEMGTRKDRSWPKHPRALRTALDRIAPALSKVGWAVGYERTPGSEGRDRIVWIAPTGGGGPSGEKKDPEATVPTVPTDPPPGDGGDEGDGDPTRSSAGEDGPPVEPGPWEEVA